ncbi:hypothetical protein SynBIOSU31_02642 [Synechococcus sp. BIOS-U3-1]|nr:hypothetical protein SynBIOSU31_02642 [Synechococcus sp. BIOS-U3-1]
MESADTILWWAPIDYRAVLVCPQQSLKGLAEAIGLMGPGLFLLNRELILELCR